jgi:hypothetical protein
MDEFTDHKKPLDFYIGELEGRQKTVAAMAAAPDYPVSERRLGDPQFPNHQRAPCSIYFYYVRINTTGDLYVRHYFYPGGNHEDVNNPADPATWPAIPNDDQVIIPILQDLVANARANGARFPLVDADFQNIRWHRKSYVVLFIDEENWTMHRGSTGNPAFLFITTGGGTPNHSFFDGRNVDIPMPQGASARSAFLCINHMKRDAAGNDLLPGDDQFFQFKVFFDVKFTSGSRALTVIFDPDGNNLGPPIPPP